MRACVGLFLCLCVCVSVPVRECVLVCLRKFVETVRNGSLRFAEYVSVQLHMRAM